MKSQNLFIDNEIIVDNIKISLVDKIKTKEEKKRDQFKRNLYK